MLPYSLKNKSKTEFVKNRFFRLYPPYWFSILLSVILVGGFSLTQILGNITMLQLFLRIKDMVGAFWTLPIELLLYVGCLIFHKYLFDKKKVVWGFVALLVFTLIVAIVRFYMETKIPVAIFLLLAISVLGYLIRLYKEKIVMNFIELFRYILLFILFLIPISLLAYNKDLGFGEVWYRYLNTYIASIVIFYFFMNQNLSNKILNYLGKISYSLYLTHGVVILFFQKQISFFLTLNIFATLALFIILTLLIAIFTYYIVEEPSFSSYKKYSQNRKRQHAQIDNNSR